jgi:tetratricopeptide (TPR) repeat protein
LDYAETRTEILLAILAALVSQTSLSPIRVLLLARSSGEWWAQLPAENARCEALLDGFATTGPYTLPPLCAELNERNHAFTQALAAFSQALQLAEPQIHPDLNAEQFHSPLYLQMAALLTLLGEHTPNAELLPQSLVRHEQRYWRRMGAGSDSEANLLMSLTTLVGYAPTVRAVEPLWLAAGGHPASLKPLFASLSPLYPAQQGLGALQPDLLGEALIASQVLGLSGAALLDAALGEKASSAQRAHALTALARLLRYRADLSSPLQIALCKHFTRCAQALFQVCIQTPGPLSLVAEQSFKQLTPALARQVAGQLESNFEHEVLPLAGLELLIRETLNTQALHRCQKPNHSMDDRSALGSTLQNLSMAHFQLGNSADALEFAKQALDIHERVAKDKPERFEPDLAGSLNNYANRLTEIGETTQALVFSKQALHIYERLAKNKPERFEPNLAMSLNNYANDLAEIGDTTQALVFSKQALDIYERLAKDKPERFEPDWAMSLNNYANHLAAAGDATQALARAKQALDIYERLVKHRPMKFDIDVQAGKLMVALWKWLADKTPLLVAPIEEIDGSEVPYKMRPVCFFRQVLHALGTEQASEKAAAFAAVWERWHVMSKAQQTRWEHTFLLACAYAEANTYLPQHLGGWRLQINALNTRRNGNLPKWMLQVAERQGFSLGIDA